MSTNISLLNVAGAMVDAGAYAPAQQAACAEPARSAQVAAEISRARVEIYCDHNAEAISHIRAASGRLAPVTPAAALVASELELAARLTRQNKYQEAEEVLESALGHMGSGFVVPTSLPAGHA